MVSELAPHGLDAAIEQRAHGAIAGIVDQHIKASELLIDPLTQGLQGRAVIDIQGQRHQALGLQRGKVFRFAGGGQDGVAGGLEGFEPTRGQCRWNNR